MLPRHVFVNCIKLQSKPLHLNCILSYLTVFDSKPVHLCCRNWHWDEPSCGTGMCVVLYHQPSAPRDEDGHFLFQWNDDNCSSKNNFVCKYREGERMMNLAHTAGKHLALMERFNLGFFIFYRENTCIYRWKDNRKTRYNTVYIHKASKCTKIYLSLIKSHCNLWCSV